MADQDRPAGADILAKCYQMTEDHEAKEAGHYLCFRPVASAQTPQIVLNGRTMVMVGSNNYLGLTTHPRVMAAAKEAVDRYGTGSAGSRWLNGNMVLHEQLEAKLAEFLRQEAAVVFATGYQTNLGAISCIVGRGDVIIIDKLDHASILDGCRMSQGEMIRYRHNDMDHLEFVLQKAGRKAKLIIIDGVFSMEGDIVNLPAIVELAGRHQARIFLDDAHGIGVLGLQGRGTAEHFDLEEEVDLIMGTFSKSLAGIGGFVAGDERPIAWIKHLSRSLMFSAALPPVLAAAAMAAVEVIETEPELRQKLWANTHQMKKGLDDLGFDTGESKTPIIPVVVGDEALVLAMTNALAELGVFVNPVRPPAVPPGRDLLRTSLMATHTSEHINQALKAFETAGQKLGLIA